jgi:hypothetical protein
MSSEEKLRRMEARIDEAARGWNEERKKFQAEIEQWRTKLAEQCGMTLAANHTATRQRDDLRRCIYALTTMRRILQEPISIQQRQYMFQLIDAALEAQDRTR